MIPLHHTPIVPPPGIEPRSSVPMDGMRTYTTARKADTGNRTPFPGLRNQCIATYALSANTFLLDHPEGVSSINQKLSQVDGRQFRSRDPLSFRDNAAILTDTTVMSLEHKPIPRVELGSLPYQGRVIATILYRQKQNERDYLISVTSLTRAVLVSS